MMKFCFLFLVVLFFYPLSSYSENTPNYSFNGRVGCKAPPKSVPRKLLSKSYKIYTYPGQWAIFDINGDGWCDWIRGGYEGYRLDQEEPTLRDFIYLGNSTGWGYYDSPQNAKHLNGDEIFKLKKHALFSDAGAVQFYEPIPVYINNERKPYLVTAIRYDAPAPPPNYDQIIVTRWNDGHGGLIEVTGKEKKSIWDFLKENLCNHPRDAYEKLYGPRVITRGPLCASN